MADNVLQFHTKNSEPDLSTKGSKLVQNIKRNRATTKAYMDARPENIERDKAYVTRAVEAIEDMMGSNSDLLRRVGLRLVRAANDMELNDKPKKS